MGNQVIEKHKFCFLISSKINYLLSIAIYLTSIVDSIYIKQVSLSEKL